MAKKKVPGEAKVRAQVQLDFVRSHLFNADLGVWSKREEEYAGPWDGDVSEYMAAQASAEDWDESDNFDEWDEDLESEESPTEGLEYDPDRLTDHRREHFRRAAAQAETIALPEIQALAFREIASNWKRWDLDQARLWVGRAHKVVEQIDDAVKRERALQDLVEAYSQHACDQQTALDLARTLPPSVRKIKALVRSWRILDPNERVLEDRRLIELAMEEIRSSVDVLFVFDGAIVIARELTPLFEEGEARRMVPEVREWMERAEEIYPEVKPKSKRDTRIRQLAEWYVHCGELEKSKALMARVSNRDHRITFYVKTAEALIADDDPRSARGYLEQAREVNEGYNASAKTPKGKQQANYKRLGDLYARVGDYRGAIELGDTIEDEWARGWLLGVVIRRATTLESADQRVTERSAWEHLSSAMEAIPEAELRDALHERLRTGGEVKDAAVESVLFMFEDDEEEEESI